MNTDNLAENCGLMHKSSADSICVFGKMEQFRWAAPLPAPPEGVLV
jgi:hypothetical protein